MKIKVILQTDVPNLGVAGDIKDVAPGYARNYLLPRRLAVSATARQLGRVTERKEALEQERTDKLAVAKQRAAEIQEIVCVLTVRAGKDGKLFGSITAGDLARHFTDKGLALDRRWIELREPIRTTGEFVGTVRLHPQVRATFKIQVKPLA